MRTVLMLSILILCACPQPVDVKPKAEAFARQLGYTPLGVACTTVDTDADGYVSCTVRIAEQTQPLAIECASAYLFTNEGCRMQKPGTGWRAQ